MGGSCGTPCATLCRIGYTGAFAIAPGCVCSIAHVLRRVVAAPRALLLVFSTLAHKPLTAVSAGFSEAHLLAHHVRRGARHVGTLGEAHLASKERGFEGRAGDRLRIAAARAEAHLWPHRQWHNTSTYGAYLLIYAQVLVDGRSMNARRIYTEASSKPLFLQPRGAQPIVAHAYDPLVL